MTFHELKSWPEYFEAVLSGAKKFEVRIDDRGFKTGDTVVLQEYDPETETYSGRFIRAEVGYVTREYCAAIPDMAGHVVFSLLYV